MRREHRTLSAKLPQVDAARLYDRLSGMYDLWAYLTETRARERALELADIRNGEEILEVAVGTGLAFVEIVRRNPNGQNVGIDISKGMLAKSKQRMAASGLSNYELSLGSAFDISAEEGSFDLLLNSYMFDLLVEGDWPKVLNEFYRVLKPEGRLVLVNMTAGEKRGSGIYEMMYRLSPSLMGGCRGVSLSGLLESQGFEVKTREYIQQMLFPSEVILAVKAGA